MAEKLAQSTTWQSADLGTVLNEIIQELNNDRIMTNTAHSQAAKLVSRAYKRNYYKECPEELRIDDAKRWTDKILELRKQAYSEVVELPAPGSLEEIGTYNLYTMEVRRMLKEKFGFCKVPGEHMRFQIMNMIEIYEHLEALDLLQKTGVDWEQVGKKYNNPWGLGQMGQLIAKD